MTSASVERIARRLQKRQQSLPTKKIQTAESRAVLGMAGQFATDPARRLDTGGILSSPSFDEAFMIAMPRILEAHPGFEALSFKAKLSREAASDEFVAQLSGRKVDGRIDLFALVLRGRLDAMEDFVQDVDAFSAFGRTFKAGGLAHQRSTVVLCPLLVDAVTAGDVFPGTLRSLTEVFQMPLQNSEFPLSRVVSSLLGDHALKASTTGLESRLVLGARIRIAEPGNPVGTDGLSPAMVDLPTRGEDEWLRRVASVLPVGVEASPPTSWSRACSRLAADEVLAELVLRAHARGMDMAGRFDGIHVCETVNRLLVSATKGLLVVGPASTAATAAYADPVWFGEILVSLADEVYQKSSEGLMPQG